jgi:hypothetical protein
MNKVQQLSNPDYMEYQYYDLTAEPNLLSSCHCSWISRIEITEIK